MPLPVAELPTAIQDVAEPQETAVSLALVAPLGDGALPSDQVEPFQVSTTGAAPASPTVTHVVAVEQLLRHNPGNHPEGGSSRNVRPIQLHRTPRQSDACSS